MSSISLQQHSTIRPHSNSRNIHFLSSYLSIFQCPFRQITPVFRLLLISTPFHSTLSTHLLTSHQSTPLPTHTHFIYTPSPLNHFHSFTIPLLYSFHTLLTRTHFISHFRFSIRQSFLLLLFIQTNNPHTHSNSLHYSLSSSLQISIPNPFICHLQPIYTTLTLPRRILVNACHNKHRTQTKN